MVGAVRGQVRAELMVPLCACHGEPMAPRNDRHNGNGWRCRTQARQAHRRYDLTEKGRARNRRWNASANAHSHKAIYELTRIR